MRETHQETKTGNVYEDGNGCYMVRIKMRRSCFQAYSICRSAKLNRENIAFIISVEFTKLDRRRFSGCTFQCLEQKRNKTPKKFLFFFSKIKLILRSLNKQQQNRTEQSFEQAESPRLSSPSISDSYYSIPKHRGQPRAREVDRRQLSQNHMSSY